MSTSKRLVWLDLEGTIIESWYNTKLINIEKIKDLLDRFGVTEIGIFSFAIYNQTDITKFNDEVKGRIESALGVDVVAVPSVIDMMNADFRFTNVHWEKGLEIHDFIAVRTKVGAFEHYIRVGYDEDTYALLIDDVVPNQTITDLDNNVVVDYLNVNHGEFDALRLQWHV